MEGNSNVFVVVGREEWCCEAEEQVVAAPRDPTSGHNDAHRTWRYDILSTILRAAAEANTTAITTTAVTADAARAAAALLGIDPEPMFVHECLAGEPRNHLVEAAAMTTTTTTTTPTKTKAWPTAASSDSSLSSFPPSLLTSSLRAASILLTRNQQSSVHAPSTPVSKHRAVDTRSCTPRQRAAQARLAGENCKLQCSQCDHLFSCKSKLNRHMLTHTGVKPFSCFCGKSFNQKPSLKSHSCRHIKKRDLPPGCDAVRDGLNGFAYEELTGYMKHADHSAQTPLCASGDDGTHAAVVPNV
jgi:hypothetical protein